MAEHLLALDLGTTGVRALVTHASGEVLARSWQALSMALPAPLHVEQNPDEMWSASLEVMRSALGESGLHARELAGLGVVCQRATAIAWRRSTGALLFPALGWQDARTRDRVRELVALGIPVNTQASCTKFEWLAQCVPAVASAIREGDLMFGTPDTWLTWKLTGGEAFVTDPGHAACTGLIDPEELTWSQGILDLFGLDASWFGRIVPTAQVVGTMPPDLLGAPVRVAARAGDQQAATFAQAVHEPGQSKLTLGTAAMLDVHIGSEFAPGSRGVHTLPLWQLPGHGCDYCLEGNVVTAGATVDWLVSLGLLADPMSLDRLCAEVPSPEGVMFVPALQGLGTPFLEESATALFVGMTRGSSAGHLVRAAVSGIAHRCVDVIEAVPEGVGPIAVDGGLARSDTVLQDIADLSGRELLRASETETTALGAAFLAALSVGLLEAPALVRERVAEHRAYRPRLSRDERDRARQAWRAALARCRSTAPDSAALG